MKVALLGTGLMGYPMAEKLLECDFPAIVYNRTRAKAEPLREKGAEIAATPEAAVNSADIIILMLKDYPAIRQTLFPAGAEIDLRNRTVIHMGTILPEESRELQRRVQQSGGDYLEAPVLGSIPNVRERRLIVMVGSRQDQFENHEKLFRCFGSEIYWVGEVGKAAAAKLALNQLIISLASAFSLALGMVQAHDIDVDVFMAILRHSAFYAPTFDKKLPRMRERSFGNPNFLLKHLLKDVELIRTAAQSAGLNTAVLEAQRQILLTAIDMGFAEDDYSALFNAVCPPELVTKVPRVS